MKSPFLQILIPCLMIAAVSCKTPDKITVQNIEKKEVNKGTPPSGVHYAIAPVMIYKTKTDYYHNVPVSLTEDGSVIASYPAITDLFLGDGFAYPTPLEGGYWLDNRGIGVGTAFLDLTYEQYTALPETPSPDELMNHLLDTDPILELYKCPCHRDTTLINRMIREGKLHTCSRLK